MSFGSWLMTWAGAKWACFPLARHMDESVHPTWISHWVEKPTENLPKSIKTSIAPLHLFAHQANIVSLYHYVCFFFNIYASTMKTISFRPKTTEHLQLLLLSKRGLAARPWFSTRPMPATRSARPRGRPSLVVSTADISIA